VIEGLRDVQLDLPLVAPRPPGGAQRAVRLGNRIVAYRFERQRRRSIGIFIDRAGLLARAPRWITIAEVEAFMAEKAEWILARLAELPIREAARVRWAEGGALDVFGRTYRFTYADGLAQPLLDGEALYVPVRHATEDGMRKSIVDWLRRLGLSTYGERIARLAPIIDVRAPRVTLSNARTQWGSCTVSGSGEARVRLHWRLVQLPERLIDYVVAHELAHLREMNHSRRFWSWVGAMIPDYALARRELRQIGANLPDL
jgi:predicted metal-dependent hydrolase